LPVLASLLLVVVSGWAIALPGGLDPSFGGDGRVTTDVTFDEWDEASAVAIQADGKIVAAGTGAFREFALVRYDAGGTIDASFDDDGIVTTSFTSFADEGAEAVAIQTDGKILAAGSAGQVYGLARYQSDGMLDTSFHDDGLVTTNLGPGFEAALDLAIQADGKIIVAGTASNHENFGLARYESDGTLDASFGGGDGKVITDFNRRDEGTSVAIQADGKIIVAGHTRFKKFALARYNPDGTLDGAFGGGDGRVTTRFMELGDQQASGVAVRPNGKIVAAGGAGKKFALARYNPDGTLDTSFGGDGRVTSDITSRLDFATDLVLPGEGKVIVGGYAASRRTFALARYRRTGALDPTFSGDGVVTTNFAGDYAAAWGLAMQGDGKIVAAGGRSSGSFSDSEFALARYLVS